MASLFLAGCATIALTPVEEDYAVEQSRQVFGSKCDAIIPVMSKGSIADALFISQSVSQGPSFIARDIAPNFITGNTAQTHVTVFGNNSAKTARVIKDALSLSGPSLPGLSLLFIGDQAHADELKPLVEAKGAAFYFREFKK